MKLYFKKAMNYLLRVGDMRPTTAWVMLAQEHEQIIWFYLGIHWLLNLVDIVLYLVLEEERMKNKKYRSLKMFPSDIILMFKNIVKFN